ncbi:hypothetical protein [Caballeronia sp. GAWG2-1]|uniref:hypothetical protein n=1 Tax=Caballeronia sp. GAWG2-1 TaxID=2921744 RepID=UPI0020292E43|nr:hypothetical protein [Caballeronia sp. GAWG2-1]
MATYRPGTNGSTVRRRSRITQFLPRFDTQRPLELDAARFDKLDLAQEYLLTDVPRDYESGYELARIIVDDHHSLTGGAVLLDECCGAFTKYQSGRGNGEIKLQLGRVFGERRWLISLDIEFRAVRRQVEFLDDGLRPDISVKVALVVSPTRVSAHGFRRALVPGTAHWRDLLTSDAQTHELVRNESVNMFHDNLLPSNAYRVRVSIDQTTMEVQAIVDAVDAMLLHLVDSSSERAQGRPAARLSATRNVWTVRQAEVYWEFGHGNAVRYTRQLRSTIWSICNDIQERAWSVDDDDELISYSMRLTASIRLALYVKGIDRIRLEVRYNKKPRGGSQLTLAGRMREIADDALLRANDGRDAILRRVSERADAPQVGGDVEMLCELVALLTAVYATNPRRVEDVLRLLLTRGGVRTGEGFQLSTSEARALVRFNVVDAARVGSPSTTGNLYPLAVRFQQLFESFGES